MTVWPENQVHREPGDPEPVEPATREVRADDDASPPLDLPSPGGGETAPALPPAPPRTLRHGTRARSAGLIAAFVLSAAVHAAVLAYLGESIARPGVEAAIDALNLQIVFEAPSAKPLAGTSAPTAAAAQSAAAGSEPEHAEEGPPTAKPERERAVPRESVQATASPTAPRAETEDENDRPAAAEATDARAMDTAPPADKTPEADAETVPEEATQLALPRANIPVPTSRPEPPRVEAKAERPRPARKAEPAPKTAPARAQATPAGKRSAKAPVSGSAASAGRKGGATAGDIAAYSRRLLRHIERHKRYPREAARQRISGAAGLSVTIDRQGRLVAARLSRGSGHALLDEAARDVVRRAAPYPRPPEGVGGNTYSFSFTLSFKP